MARRMADELYRAEQLEHRYDEHVAPLNRLVDELRAQHPGRFVPYVAPGSAGVGARVLTLHRSPSPATDPDAGGSGFASLEDDDGSAERHLGLLEAAGIDPALVLPWNGVPYAVPEDEPLTATDVKAGRLALDAVVRLLPALRCVVVHGRDAEPVWTAYLAGANSLPAGVRVEPVALSTRDSALLQHRASRLRRLAATYASVAEALR